MTTNKTIHSFQSGAFVYAHTYGWHVGKSDSDQQEMIPQQILLHKPIQTDSSGKIRIAAHARNPDRTQWWVELTKLSGFTGLYYAYEPQPEGMRLLVFHKPKLGYTRPFRLIVLPVEGTLPKPPALWAEVDRLLTQLPPINERAVLDQ